ncbi:hypothetical protein CHARACLAT_017122 [Characodon lateralis]|uniref:Uncharacterized protein n=1 Tax=Characodon lateralis TaxID=208331 RepID=A0ABU7EAI5_9TELE|nr:hypothetical protein [Characodon lateralis]
MLSEADKSPVLTWAERPLREEAFTQKATSSMVYTHLSLQGCKELVSVSSSYWARSRVYPVEVTTPSQGNTETKDEQPYTHTFISHKAIKSDQLGEEAGVAGENLRMQRENMQTLFLLQGNSATNCTTMQPNIQNQITVCKYTLMLC